MPVEEQLEEQVEPQENAAPAEEQGEIASESAADETASKPEANPSGKLQKRLDKLSSKAALAEERAEYWRKQAEMAAAKPVAAPEQPKPEGKPKEDDYGTAAEYVEALADWKYEQRSKEERAAAQRQEQERTQRELQDKVSKDIAAFRTATPDFDEVMEEASFQSTPLMLREMQESDMGPAILYHFAKNPGEANDIAKLTDERKVAKAIAKIEAKLSSAPAAKSQAPTTTAPSPIKPVAASRSAIAALPQTDDDTEYFRQRREQQAAGKR